MDLDKVYQLMDKFEQSSLTDFEYRDQEFEIQLGKKGHRKATVAGQPVPLPNAPVTEVAPVTPAPVVNTPVTPAATPTPVGTRLAPEQTTDEIDPKECVTAPVVGIYYQAHSADEAPYVKIGDHVSVGQQVGLIQAMQMMRPVVAQQAGQVKALLAKNGDEVNFGQPLLQLALDTPSEV
ncbi:acetyl-CoA carboxylase biotin carboxyl carrier protein subunit [Lactobacillus sp. CBA3606]|uniref:acetyl-CoA carboxylase biotin carboxyl carrier protein n=1 Tax=Lactobacillus sp. CBA3606 TaxID=2099789 RepID=UPI000CFD24C3|nr:acetyl-CoA carboxylase biotin carboxyl carrier protein subunit [Lactobacillus sp. CBA3606]AVK64337.1 acetyl-CoA carboxylase biotin carboxyl carrier protein subunit [Lactobacillus sp. CBA3606]